VTKIALIYRKGKIRLAPYRADVNSLTAQYLYGAQCRSSLE